MLSHQIRALTFSAISLFACFSNCSFAQFTPPPGTQVSASQARFAVPSPYAGTNTYSAQQPYTYNAQPLIGQSFETAAPAANSSLPPIVLGDSNQQDVTYSNMTQQVLPTDMPPGMIVEAPQMVFQESDHATPIDNRQRKRFWFSTVEATFLKPKMDLPNASNFVFNNLKTIGTRIEGKDIESFYSAPRLTLGLQGEKGAVAFRYWHLDASENEYNDPHDFVRSGEPTEIGNTFEQFDLDMYTMDIEFQRKLNFRNNANTKFLLGTRYVDYQSSAFAKASDLFPDDIYGSFNHFNELNYQGLGFVTGLAGSRALRRGWNLKWSGRAAGIFGDYFNHQSSIGAFNGDFALAEANINNSTTNSRTISANPTPNYNVEARANATAPDRSSLWIFEGQIGLNYSRPLANLPATGHFGFGFEYQYWDLPEGEIEAAIALGPTTLQDPIPRSAGVNLTGFNVSAGITY